MKKHIVICADGTWNRPEKDLKEDCPTNVLQLSRAIKPIAKGGIPQHVFYDWGIGSYYNKFVGGITGKGINKNIMDGYRYIIQNYAPGDDIFLFGFSRGAYTVRALSGLIYNCGILKRPDAHLVQSAFDHYKKTSGAYAPKGEKSVAFRRKHSHPSREIKMIGVWDTVGALGVPFSFLGLFEPEDQFYDTKLGPNVRIARHALAIDEVREDFEPTIWHPRRNLDLQQVWFPGVHADIGGSYKPDKNGFLLSDVTLKWMLDEAAIAGLTVETHLTSNLKPSATASKHRSYRSIYRFKDPYHRPLAHGRGEVMIHKSVKQRWTADSGYRPKNLNRYIKKHDWPVNLIE